VVTGFLVPGGKRNRKTPPEVGKEKVDDAGTKKEESGTVELERRGNKGNKGTCSGGKDISLLRKKKVKTNS